MQIAITKTKTYFKLIDGFWGGVLSGVLTVIFGMLVSLVTGKGFFWPLAIIGYTFQPYAEMPDLNPGAMLTGLLILMGYCMIGGVVFVMLANAFINQKRFLWFWAMLYALLVWVIMQFWLLRLVNPIFLEQANPIVSLLAHVVYGVSLGAYVSRKTNDNNGEEKNLI